MGADPNLVIAGRTSAPAITGVEDAIGGSLMKQQALMRFFWLVLKQEASWIPSQKT